MRNLRGINNWMKKKGNFSDAAGRAAEIPWKFIAHVHHNSHPPRSPSFPRSVHRDRDGGIGKVDSLRVTEPPVPFDPVVFFFRVREVDLLRNRFIYPPAQCSPQTRQLVIIIASHGWLRLARNWWLNNWIISLHFLSPHLDYRGFLFMGADYPKS